MRSGYWKYFEEGDNEYLFDLSVDAGEQANFKGQRPDVFQRLKGEYQEWQSQMLPQRSLHARFGIRRLDRPDRTLAHLSCLT